VTDPLVGAPARSEGTPGAPHHRSATVSRTALAASSVLGGLSAALVPILAVFLLEVRDYGAFAFVYLVFAQGWSIALSAVCDTWARQRVANVSAGSWGSYTGALGTISGASAIVALLVALPMFDSPLQASAMAVGVGASLYRQAARFHHAATRGPWAVLPSDVVAVVVFLAALVAGQALGHPLLTSLLLAWAVSAVAAAAFYLPGAFRDGGLASWYRRNRTIARSLLGESLLMDAGAAGTPMLIAPVLGLHDFGIYRSVSSLSVPVQLLIDPVRPYLSQAPLKRIISPQVVAALFTIAALLCGAVFAILRYLVPVALSFSPVLRELSAYALPCGLFLAFQFLTFVFNIFARMHVNHRRLIVGRIGHTVLAIAVPITGAVVGSVSGAIWGYVFTTALTVALWLGLLLVTPRQHEVPTAE
jgi:hypothetical protein